MGLERGLSREDKLTRCVSFQPFTASGSPSLDRAKVFISPVPVSRVVRVRLSAPTKYEASRAFRGRKIARPVFPNFGGICGLGQAAFRPFTPAFATRVAPKSSLSRLNITFSLSERPGWPRPQAVGLVVVDELFSGGIDGKLAL